MRILAICLILAVTCCISVIANARPERALRDSNGTPAMIGDYSTETINVKLTADGYLAVATS